MPVICGIIGILRAIIALPSKTLFPLVSRIQNPLTYFTFRFLRPARFARILTVIIKVEHVTLRMSSYALKLGLIKNAGGEARQFCPSKCSQIIYGTYLGQISIFFHETKFIPNYTYSTIFNLKYIKTRI